MTPIQQLIQVAEGKGVKLTERRVGTEGVRKIFEAAGPMPPAVRAMGLRMKGLDYHYWMAGDEGLKEGFGDFERGEDLHFPAELFSMRRLKFYLRRFKLQRQFWHGERLVSKLKRQWRDSDGPRVHLDSERIGPRTGEYQRIEAASDLVSEKLRASTEECGWRLYWSWGDSSAWRIIVAVPNEAELEKLIASTTLAEFAGEVAAVIGSVVDLDYTFKLHLELDSDERVNASEGWFFRVKSDARPGREFVFDADSQQLSALEPQQDG